MTRTTVTVEEYVVADRDAGPYAVTAGPDAALRFTRAPFRPAPAPGPVGVAGDLRADIGKRQC